LIATNSENLKKIEGPSLTAGDLHQNDPFIFLNCKISRNL